MRGSTKYTVQKTIRIDHNLYAVLRKYAEDNGISFSDAVRVAVKGWVKAHEALKKLEQDAGPATIYDIGK